MRLIDVDELLNVKIKVDLIMIAILMVLLFIFKCINATSWNNGYCSCGGKWIYQQAIGHTYNTYYLYECDKCGKQYEFSKKW